MKRLQNHFCAPIRACGHTDPNGHVLYGTDAETAAQFAALKRTDCEACQERQIAALRRVIAA